MYEDFFKLHGRPFLSTPQVDRYFPAPILETARQTLVRCIERGEGTGLLVGPAGTGKTLLCMALAREFEDRFDIALLTGGRLGTRAALLQAILYEVGLPYRGMDEGELRLSLIDSLEPATEEKAGLVLLIDEAHTLPLRLLEEIRMLTNLVRDGQPRVRVVLAGSSSLEERFASPKLTSFAQRLAARTYLEPLDAAESSAYVRAQLVAVGGDPQKLLDDETLRSIYQASDGIPRLINQICDHALLLASLGGHDRLSSQAIEEAWADLQRLPTPWSAGANESAGGSVVEFGQLDEAADLPGSIPFRPAEVPSRSREQAVEEPVGADAASSEHEDTRLGSQEAGTEVELDFPEFGDPLGEQFAEEEVVLDRYGSDVEVFADVPRVTSWEGGQLADLLDTVDVSASRSSSEDSMTVKFGVQPAGEPQEATAEAPSSDEVDAGGAAPPVGDNAPLELASVDTHAISDAGGATFWAGAKAAEELDELLIIEERNEVEVVRPRKRAYGQLFAKLRRG